MSADLMAPPDVAVAIVERRRLLQDAIQRGLDDRRHRLSAKVTEVAGLSSLSPAEVVDVVLLGVDTAPLDELEAAIRGLLSRGTRVVAVSTGALDDRGSRLLLAGCSGFLDLSDATLGAVSQAVDTVAAGSAVLHPAVALAVLEQWRLARSAEHATPGDSSPLSRRESDVLRGLASGLTGRQLAKTLGVAEKTVEAHKSRLFRKLGARNQAHAVALATSQGLLD